MRQQDWQLEERKNYEPDAVAPQLRWRITTKSHNQALPRTVALVATKDDATLATAAPKMLEALNCWREAFRASVARKATKRVIDRAWRLTAVALNAAGQEEQT
jgi:hypothetical protein